MLKYIVVKAMMAEIIKTTGIVLRIRPWSRTSHVVTWLTPDRGVVATVVRGAVRPKSFALGQYDLYYTCDLLYYARATGDAHPLREVTPRDLRAHLRGDWRAVALAGYACDLVADLAPPDATAAAWFDFLARFLDGAGGGPARLVALEMGLLRLAGLAPDFTGLDPAAAWSPFAVDLGRIGATGTRTYRLTPAVAAALVKPFDEKNLNILLDAVRFLGVFLSYHLEKPAEVRRTVVRTAVENPT